MSSDHQNPEEIKTLGMTVLLIKIAAAMTTENDFRARWNEA